MEPVLDDMGRMILRDEYYIDGLNCDPMAFDKECKKTNTMFRKNHKKSEIKSHHYIISFDPADSIECNLTGERAQTLCLDFARRNFPGYQALVVTHTDGHHGSGNIHTHIVINSVRKFTVAREEYMDQLHDHEAGYKHRSTTRFLNHLQNELMEMCKQEGLHQIDLFAPASTKITQKEYQVQTHGQEQLDKLNQQIIADGLEPANTIFKTQKQFLRDAIDKCSHHVNNFQEFQSMLFENYSISVIEQRGLYRYLHPDRKKRISEQSLGTNYGKKHLEQIFAQADIIAALQIRSKLRLVVDLQTNVKAMQNQAYARKVKISNLKQMANTIIYIQEHQYDTRESLKQTLSTTQKKYEKAQKELFLLSSKIKTINCQIHYTGQYYASKTSYMEFLKSPNKKQYRQQHASTINAYEEARSWLKDFYPDENFLSLKTLKAQKKQLQEQFAEQKQKVRFLKEHHRELKTVSANIDKILKIQNPLKQNTKFPMR